MATVRPKLREASAASSSCSTPQRWRSEDVKSLVEGRTHSDELAEQTGGELGDRYAVLSTNADDLLAVGFRFRCPLKVEKARVAGRELDAPVAQVRGPAADRGP